MGTDKDRLIAGILENIVMLELERRGYRVFAGKLDTKKELWSKRGVLAVILFTTFTK